MHRSDLTEPDPFAEYVGPVVDAASIPAPTPVAEHIPEPRPPAPADIVWADDLGEHTDAAQAEYDLLRRVEAQVAGEPVRRTRTPGTPPAISEGEPMPFAFVWVDAGSGRVIYRKEHSEPTTPRRLGVLGLRELIDNGFRLVVPDQYTAKRLSRAAAAAAAGDTPEAADAARVDRQLAVASRLSYSISLVVLTEALQRAYWLSADLDADDPLAWSRAFDPRLRLAGRPYQLMHSLLEAASQGQERTDATTAMFYGELAAIAAARHPGQRARVAAFQGMNRAENAAKVWDTTDLGLIGRNLVTGDVCAIEVSDTSGRGFTATMSQPFKLRTGHRHVFLAPPGDPAAEAAFVLMGVRATTSGDLIGQFEAVTTRRNAPAVPPAVTVAADAMANGRTLHITEEPYLPFLRSRGDDEEAGRWTRGRTVDRVRPRWGMPADVKVAHTTRTRKEHR
ncbi:hypothetical protein [Pseudactinotalea terrae]|uniref:hypothetical protein n=1 Tax=Pseudactinotalea terrae TaxID=1743262 RepID=UPI0012E13BE8|nr:hypothetical protein [Pseudactinotalea terrae]